MLSIFYKEINAFFSSLIGYFVVGIFLVFMGLTLFVFPQTSLLQYNFATLDQLFDLAPMVFMFLIPAITMRSFAEERQSGTIELLSTRPISDLKIVLGKYFACLTLVAFALLPTVLDYVTVHQLGSPPGNLDSGAILGSYIGLLLLSAVFVGIGVFASSLSDNQIVAFLLATFLCFLFFYGFLYFSELPIFLGKGDDIVQMFGIDYHYRSISRGILDTRDFVYFISVIGLFLFFTLLSLDKQKG